MLRKVLLLLALGVATPLTAQTIVRAGEHEYFTRIVFPTRHLASIKADKVNRTIVVSGDPKIRDLDVSELFSRINRSRIASVSIDRDKARAIINLACDCSFTSIAYESGHFVIDIKDALPRSTNLKNIGKGFLNHQLRRHLKRPILSASKRKVDTLDLPYIQRTLELGINDAIRTGRLNKDTNSKQQLHSSKEVFSPKNNKNLNHDIERINQIKISNKCSQKKIIFQSEFSEEPANYISAARREFADKSEFSKDTQNKKLVRTYLTLGFGAEARASMSNPEQSNEALLALSYILDTGTDRLNYFKDLQDCDHQVAYWSIFNNQTNLKNLNVRTILETIQQLPEGMLYATGEVALEKLKARADQSTYHAIKPPLQRRLENQMTGRNTNNMSTHTDKHVVSMNPKHALLSDFLKRISRNYETGKFVSDEDMRLLNGYQREYYANKQSWLRIGQAKAISMLSRGNIKGAYETTSTMREGLETKEYEKYLNEVAKALINIDSPFGFLEAAFPIITEDASHLALNHQIVISERLIELGMLDLAQSIVETWHKPYRSENQDIILAKLSQHQNKPLAARSQIAGLSSLSALRALAAIDMDLGHYGEAERHFVQSKDQQRAAHALWLSGKMPDIFQDEPDFIRLSRNLASQSVQETTETLEARKALLSEAEAQSNSIKQILALSIE